MILRESLPGLLSQAESKRVLLELQPASFLDEFLFELSNFKISILNERASGY